ncbi:hypothetical protein ACSBR1_026713 [Camellia fascicularis]
MRLIEVTQGLKEGKCCIGLALVETLMDLDAFHRGETTHFTGSPLLLQVWLMDKLRVVGPCPEYLARAYFFLQRLIDFPLEGLWCDWMCSRSTADRSWRCPWFNLAGMSYNMSRQSGIELIGLTHCVFYFPLQFRRQFGHDQIRPDEGVEYTTSFPIRTSHLPRYLMAWRTREILAPAISFSYTLPEECLAWLEEEAEVGLFLAWSHLTQLCP